MTYGFIIILFILGTFTKSSRNSLSSVSHLSKRWFGQPAAQTHPHLIKEGEVTPGITKDEYKRRRCNLIRLALQSHSNKNHIMIVPSATKQIMTSVIPYPFHQNTDFWYLCGFLEPDSLLVMQFNGEQSPNTALFVPKRDPEKEMWDGPRSGIEGTLQLTGVDSAFNTDHLGDFLYGYLCDNSDFVVWYNKKSIVNPALQNNAVNDFIKEGKHSEIENVSTILQTLRLFKSQTEVNLMRKSCDIVADAFREVMMYSHPGVSFVGCIDLILLPANVQLFLTFQFFLPISVSNISYTRLLSFILLPTCTDMAFF